MLARWAQQRNVPLVHFSTDYVFDGSGERPWREDDATGPLSAYGESKLAGEEAIRAAGGTFLIVRSSWVYAATGTNFLRTIARLARERKELRIVSDQVGAPTSAAVIAKAVMAMLGDDLEEFRLRCAQAGGLVHLAASGETSWHGFATAIVDGLKARGVKLAVEQVHAIKSEDYPTRAKRPRNSCLDLSRLQQVFGITPPPWRDALPCRRGAEWLRHGLEPDQRQVDHIAWIDTLKKSIGSRDSHVDPAVLAAHGDVAITSMVAWPALAAGVGVAPNCRR